MKKASIIFGIFIILAPWIALGSDIATRQSTLYPFKNSIELQEEFISGNATSGQIGALGWISTAGTTSVVSSESNRLGLLRRDTTAASGTIAQFLQGFTSSLINGSPYRLLWVTRLNTNDANTTIRIGAANAYSANPPTSGTYFEKLDGDTNMFCVTRASGVETRTDSGIAVSTSFTTFLTIDNITSVLFYINGALVCTHSTNLPAAFINPGLHIINSAAAAKTIDIDYFQLQIFGLQR